MTSLTYSLPPDLAQAVAENLRAWESSDRVARIWAGDATVWTGTDEAQWLGWLRITGEQLAQKQRFEQFAAEVKAAGFTDILLLGMGGSSLCPEVLRLSFGGQRRVPRAARARFDRSGADGGDRKEDRPGAHAVHRFEQVGIDARTEYLQAIFLRARRPRRQPLRRDHRSGLEDAAGGRAGWFPAHLFRTAVALADGIRRSRISA